MVIVERIGPSQWRRARDTFALLARVFNESQEALDEPYLTQLLSDRRFWALTALADEHVVGGVTAWTLPLTTHQQQELMIYDLAVDPSFQRRGIGSRLIDTLLRQASELGISVAWVPVDDDDAHAIDFYRSIGGKGQPATIFTFGRTD